MTQVTELQPRGGSGMERSGNAQSLIFHNREEKFNLGWACSGPLLWKRMNGQIHPVIKNSMINDLISSFIHSSIKVFTGLLM
jgi:hypothetical protein